MTSTAGAEWRRYGIIPLVAAMGLATSTIAFYGFGPYIAPVSESFGWSRTQATLGLAITTLVGALFAVPIGMAVDRFGSRRIGVVGALTAPAAFALLGTADGSQVQWLVLWMIMAIALLPTQVTIWTSAVLSRFEVSRGLALAVTLSGTSAAAAVFPLLGAWLIEMHGWQRAMVWQGAIWAAIVFLPILIFFRGARDVGRAGGQPAARATGGMNLKQGLRTIAYWKLLLVSILFMLSIMGIVVHFVPILAVAGLDPVTAAGYAALIGLFSLIGRIGAGLLLDHIPDAWVGGGACLLPPIGIALLIASDGNPAMMALAAALIGLTLGAEGDVLAYMTSRLFGLASFGSLFGGLTVALALGVTIGPLAAASTYDQTGGYAPFLWATIPILLLCSAILFTMPRARKPA
ncbi:MAG: MFS transporter [Sandarakinorhabdus sp.]|nr:MFS transporter [Sandarakinorhabdus sp.]